MNAAKTILLPSLLLLCMIASARQVTDTLTSSQQDQVILTYDVAQKDGALKISFKGVNKKKLGKANKDKYDDLTEVKVMFFDRMGSFDGITFNGLDPSVFMVPSELEYERSEDGYFFLDDNPVLSFKGIPKKNTVISFPMYLAHYEKKAHYKLFSQCGNLVIRLGDLFSQPQQQGSKDAENTFIEVEIDGELSETEADALASVNYVLDELQSVNSLPFSDMLNSEVEGLKKLKYKVQNQEIAERIDQALTSFEEKKQSLEKQAAADAAAAQIEAKKQDSIATAQALQQQEEEKAEAEAKEKQEKKRNIWMIIGGVLLAILLFTGNQLMQSFRTKKTQKNLMQMQQDAAKQAENKLKQKVESEIKKKTNKAAEQAKQKGKEMVQNGINKATSGKTNGNNKKISI